MKQLVMKQMVFLFSLRRWLVGAAAFAGTVLFAFAPPACAQSAEKVLRTTLERYEQRMEGVKNYTVVHEGGAEFYYEREQKDGHYVYRPVIAGLPQNQRPKASASDPYTFFNEVASQGRLAGTETIEGHRAYMIEVGELAGTDLWSDSEETSDFEPRSATFWIDAQRYVPLRMVIEGVSDAQGERRPVTLEGQMSDYREVEGILYPFQMRMTFEGLVSSEQQKQMRESMAKMREQLEQMPPAQRERIKQMMGGKMADMMGGNMAFTVNVKEVRVNAGPPGDGR